MLTRTATSFIWHTRMSGIPQRAAFRHWWIPSSIRFIYTMIRFSFPSTIKKEHRPSPLEKRQKLHPREMVRIWIAFLHQEKPVHIVYWFFFFVCAMKGARTGRWRIAPQAISPVGCCLARGFQRVGMSTVEAVDRKISWLFCFVSHGCTVSARFLHGRCYPCPMM